MSKSDWNLRCPKCNWVPNENSFWECTCGFKENSFDQLGKCKNCKVELASQKCNNTKNKKEGCGEWSNIIDWFDIGEDEVIYEIIDDTDDE